LENLSKILKRCRKDDRKAQNELFHFYADYIMNLTRRYINDKQDAKAIFLESFELIFRKMDQYSPKKGTFKSWISKITINQCLAELRKRRLFYTDELQVVESVYQDKLIEEMDAGYLIEMINKLGEPYNIIFNMVVDGYKHKEIASHLDLEESTSRSYYMRARSKLKEQIIELKKTKSWNQEII